MLPNNEKAEWKILAKCGGSGGGVSEGRSDYSQGIGRGLGGGRVNASTHVPVPEQLRPGRGRGIPARVSSAENDG